MECLIELEYGYFVNRLAVSDGIYYMFIFLHWISTILEVQYPHTKLTSKKYWYLEYPIRKYLVKSQKNSC